MKNYKWNGAFILTLMFIFVCGFTSRKNTSQSIENLQFVMDMDGQKILSSVDAIIEGRPNNVNTDFSLFGFGKKHQLGEEASNKINTDNSQLAALWNSTVMVFGAAADGVGIGTAFAIKKASDGRMFFVTNFHVVEKFCNLPEGVYSDLAEADSMKYPCQALFILHDVAINTQNNLAAIDGLHPWKSEVLSLDYFDKQRDLAVFKINLPGKSDVLPASIETNYDLKTLLLAENNAEKIETDIPPVVKDGIKMSSMTNFSFYLAAYSMPTPKDQKKEELAWIKKHWSKGLIKGTRTFENDKKLGFITALKHDIEVLPGSSGGPLALSDGRIVGINTSVEIKQFYARYWGIKWLKYKLETYNSYFAMPVTFVKDFFDKLN